MKLVVNSPLSETSLCVNRFGEVRPPKSEGLNEIIVCQVATMKVARPFQRAPITATVKGYS